MNFLFNELSLIDATLREGNQSPGVKYSVEDSVVIAKALAGLGVNTIEIGHPFVSSLEFQRVKAVVDLGLTPSILTHARAHHNDIKAVAETGASWVGIFAGLNPRARRVSLGDRTEEEILKIIHETVSYAKTFNLKVRYTIEDSSRTDTDVLLRGFEHAILAGADRICFSDSVGVLEPLEVYKVVDILRKSFPSIPIEVHFHDDRGLALANSLAAIDAGVNWISCSVNGVGERSGITDTLTLITNLHFRNPSQMELPKPGLLKKVSKLVNGLTRSSVHCRQPVVGKNTFIHTAKLHKDAVKKEMSSYAWIDPEKIGSTNVIDFESVPQDYSKYILKPEIVSATELKYHRHGPGDRYVMIDDRYLKDCRLYSIVRKIYGVNENTTGHVDNHRHHVDSLFIFLSYSVDLAGLKVEVLLGDERFQVESPASVFIPSGVKHSYRVISGEGLFINTVLSGSYNESLLEYDFV